MKNENGKILIVDDEIINIRVLEKILNARNYETISTINSLEVMDLLVKNEISLILLDIRMPKLDGFHLIKMIKKDVLLREIPIIFLTGLSETEILATAFELGCSDYITKPFKKEELLARIKTHLKIQNMQKTLKNRNNELSKLNEEKNQLFGVAAHDIRNPLGVITGYLEILLSVQNLEGEKYLKILRNMSSSANHVLNMVNDLLEFAHYESKKINLKLETANLYEVLDDIVSMNRIIAERKNIRIEYSFKGNHNLKFKVDVPKFRQVMDNLISNGIKYSEPGTEICVNVNPDANNIWILVEDQGQGISREEIKKLFKPFSTTSNKATAGERSTGLGLVIVKNIIEAHNGKIWVESTKGVGSKFSVLLPMIST